MDKEERTTLFIEFMWGVLKWGLVGFLLLGTEGCIQPSLVETQPPILISISDERGDEHKYRKFPYSGTSQFYLHKTSTTTTVLYSEVNSITALIFSTIYITA